MADAEATLAQAVEAVEVDQEDDDDQEDAAPAARGPRLCQCGCGQVIRPSEKRSRYKKGHAPGVVGARERASRNAHRKASPAVVDATPDAPSLAGAGGKLSARLWSPEDLAVTQTAVVMILMAVTAYAEQRRGVPRMTLEEAQALGNPVGRIALRHTRVKQALQGDIADGVAILAALVAYTTRLISSNRSVNVVSSGQDTDTPVSGLDQYAYKPPAEATVQPQNGSAA